MAVKALRLSTCSIVGAIAAGSVRLEFQDRLPEGLAAA